MSVAPRLLAIVSLSGNTSTATIWRAPARLAPSKAENPTPPSPTTATVEPGETRAVLSTAPTPVSTAQPKSAASSNGNSGSILISECRDTVAYSAKAEQPRMMVMRRTVAAQPPRAREQRARGIGRRARFAQCGASLRARQAMPATRHEHQHHVIALLEVIHAGPDSSTVPAASCPSTMGVGRGRSPLITDKSEWQRPGSAHPDQHFTLPGGPSSSTLFDGKWLGLGIRRLHSHRVQHRSLDLHDWSP